MTSPGFSFPPESYSAVYVEGKSDANGTAGAPAPGLPHECVGESSPTSARANNSLFSCFYCAIPKRIKVLRKQKNETKQKGTAGAPAPGLPHECVGESSPTSARANNSLFSCFYCAIPKRIKVLRKQKNETKQKVAVPGKDEDRWRSKDEGALFKRWRRSSPEVAPPATPAQPSELLKFLAINALELSAPASDALLKSRSSEWFQLAGHPGSLAPAGPGTVWKRRSPGDHPHHNPERDAYEALAACPHMRSAIPRYYRELEYGGESFIELQDLLHGFRDPHVMDVKMGTRTFLEDEVSNARARADLYEKMVRLDPNAPTEAEHAARAVTKLRYMQFREERSSSAEQGFRIEAVKLPGEPALTDLQNVREPHQLAATVARFLGKNDRARRAIATRLREIRDLFERSDFFKKHEIVGSSIFIIYDEERAGAWLIDFAKTRSVPDGAEVSHRAPWEQGNHEEGFLFGLDRLIDIIETADLPAQEAEPDVSR